MCANVYNAKPHARKGVGAFGLAETSINHHGVVSNAHTSVTMGMPKGGTADIVSLFVFLLVCDQ